MREAVKGELAMATCAGDEFGNLYADACREDVGALNGFGSLYWSYEDDSDSSADIASSKVRPERLSEDSGTGATKEECTRAQSKLVSDGMEEERKATFIDAGSCKGASPAQATSKQDHLTEVANSKCYLRHTGGATLGAEDVDTDSDDDLHIVLNSLEGVVNEGSNEDSEDGEDFIILAGSKTMNDEEWQEGSCSPLEEKAQALREECERLGTLGDEKGQNGKSPGVQPRIGYGSQIYHRHYRYVRGSGPSSVAASASASAKINGKPDRFGRGRGFLNLQRGSLPARRSGTFRGPSCGLEYSIPMNKTVFDVDIDALQEKPWRLSYVDVSDYFNFGFDEISWKKYCKQLAQFCLEITTQSKISVYEGGRAGQSTTNALQDGGDREPWPSANTQALQIRESNAIFLIDAKDDRMSQSCSEGQAVDSREVHKFLQNGQPRSDTPLGNERGICETALPAVVVANQTSSTRLGDEPQNCGAGSGNRTQVNGSVLICPGDDSMIPSALRPKTLSPSTPPERVPTQDKRDKGRGKSQSSSLNDGSQFVQEDHVSGVICRNENVERKETLQLGDFVRTCGRRRVNAALAFCAGNYLSGRLDKKRRSSHVVTSSLCKKRRLGLQKVNHDAHHSTQIIEMLSRPHSSTAGLGAYKSYAQAEITPQKKHMNINNAVEFLNDDKSVDQYVNGFNEQHILNKAERKTISVSSRAEIKKSKGHGEAYSSNVKGRLQGIHCGSAEKKSKEKLKTKKLRKSHKCKERLESKGCLNLEEGQVEGFDKTSIIKNQGPGNMSMISFVSKDNCYYWKKVGNMSLCHIQDLETEQKTEAKNTTHKSINSLLEHLENEGDKEIKNVVLKLDGNVHQEAASSLIASQVLKSKNKDVRHILSEECRVALKNTGSLSNSIFETHARGSMHVAFSEQVSSGQRKCSERNERQGIRKQSLPDTNDNAEGLTDSEVPHGQRYKKHRPKKLHKSSCRHSNQPIIARLAGRQKQGSITINLDLVQDTELMKGRNGDTSPFMCGRIVDGSDFNDKDRRVDSGICQSEMHSPKACDSKLSNFSGDALKGNNCIGFKTPMKLPNVSTDMKNGNNSIGLDISRLHENHSPAEALFVEEESIHATSSESSQEVKQRGRSKFERWTSHSEQVTQNTCFGMSDKQNAGRISLGRKFPASKFGQFSKAHLEESAPESMKRGDNCAVPSGAQTKWAIARKHKGRWRTVKENDNLTIRKNDGETVEQRLDQFAAKLEKRRERFNLPLMEETQLLQSPAINNVRESLRRSAIKVVPFTAVRLERPARKRCWGGG